MASLYQLIPQGIDSGLDGAIVEPVPHPDDEAPQEIRIHAGFQDRLTVNVLSKLPDQAFALIVR
jgi:hypothetical protein